MNNMLSIDCIGTYLVTILHNSLYIKWSKSACVLMNCHLALKFEYNMSHECIRRNRIVMIWYLHYHHII
jgi:hypothetical protein